MSVPATRGSSFARCSDSRIVRAWLAGAIGLLVLVTLGPVPASAAAGPSIGGDVVVAPAPDYATEMRGNPFDYSDAADLLTDGYATAGWAPVKGTTGKPTFSGGKASWTMNSNGGHVFPVWMTFPGALPDADDGWWTPIDADRYTRVAVRMHATAPSTGGAIDFWHCNEPLDVTRCAGRKAFGIASGWQTYLFDLAAGGTQFATWDGEKIGLQLTLNSASGTTFTLDWVRIYAPTQTFAPSRTGTLRWDRDTSTANNTASNPDWGVLPNGRFEVGAFPPGTYHLLDDAGYGDTITIDDPPQPKILDPDAAGGDDYATTVTGDAWDFSQQSDILELGGAGAASWAGGALEATNSGNDPYVRMRLNGAIDADRYHRLTVTTSYEGQFDLEDAPGGGAHGRAIFWTAQDGDWNFANSRELVTFTDRTTYTYDLADPRLVTTEPGSPRWDGAVTYFRWDPNEDPGARRWSVDEIRLAADDEADPVFDVRWLDPSHQPGTTVTIGLDGDRRGFTGTTIATGVAQQAGVNTHRLDARDLLPGLYWVWVKADDGVSTTSTYATGPLRISDRIAGPDRISTAVALSQSAYPDGADVAAVATAGTFADALAGSQLAAAADAPILLSGKDRLDTAVAAELQRLGVRTVYLLGGSASLSSQVEADIEALPGVTARRLAGSQRELTAVAIAREAVALWQDAGAAPGPLLVAQAFDFPDALSAGQLVAARRSPLLLIPGDRPAPAEVAAFVDELDPGEVVAVGGPVSVPHERLVAVAGGRPTDRISGDGRHETAVAVRAAAMAAGADGSRVLIASGRTFPDALAAAAVLVTRRGTLLTSDAATLPAPTDTALREGAVAWYRLVGGPNTLSQQVADQVAAAAR